MLAFLEQYQLALWMIQLCMMPTECKEAENARSPALFAVSITSRMYHFLVLLCITFKNQAEWGHNQDVNSIKRSDRTTCNRPWTAEFEVSRIPVPIAGV